MAQFLSLAAIIACAAAQDSPADTSELGVVAEQHANDTAQQIVGGVAPQPVSNATVESTAGHVEQAVVGAQQPDIVTGNSTVKAQLPEESNSTAEAQLPEESNKIPTEDPVPKAARMLETSTSSSPENINPLKLDVKVEAQLPKESNSTVMDPVPKAARMLEASTIWENPWAIAGLTTLGVASLSFIGLVGYLIFAWVDSGSATEMEVDDKADGETIQDGYLNNGAKAEVKSAQDKVDSLTKQVEGKAAEDVTEAEKKELEEAQVELDLAKQDLELLGSTEDEEVPVGQQKADVNHNGDAGVKTSTKAPQGPNAPADASTKAPQGPNATEGNSAMSYGITVVAVLMALCF